jgi:XamI restriction endonuclease
LFTDQRRDEGPRAYATVYYELEPRIRASFEATDDLRSVTGEALLQDPLLWQVLRYCCAPPISEEDLWTMVGRKFRRVPPEIADATAEAVQPLFDPIRFPWLEQDRYPTDTERDASLLATTAMYASVMTGTRRRGDVSARQEAAVAAILTSSGFDFDAGRAAISVLDALERGSFSRERKVAGAKCDVPVRLRDGRLLAIECKVSNGPKNSWKRLNREVGGKAERWHGAFGTQVVTAAVLAGVFDLSCLIAGQNDEGVALFWEHDLSALVYFVDEAV